MPEQVISNARLVLAEEEIHGSLLVRNGRIADVSSGPSSLSGALDVEGDFIIPGLVELHTDNLERHIMPRPRSYWPVPAAVSNHDREVVAAGITTVFDALSVGHVDTGSRSAALLQDMSAAVATLNARGSLKAEHFMHWRCEISCRDIMAHLEPLMDNTRTALVSVMDHTPGQRQFASLETYANYYKTKYGFSDDEMQAYMSRRCEDHQLHAQSNRREVVRQAHARDLAIASHDDATEDHVSEAVEDGIVVAEFPTTIEAAKASHENGLAVLMGAPNVVRGQSHSGNVSARDLAERGYLDILSSDYVPFSLLHGAALLAKTVDSITLPQAIATVSRNPARQVGLDDRGEIAPGKRADLVRYRLDGDLPSVMEVWREGARIG